MRQAGVVAAAGLEGLRDVDRPTTDHENAVLFADHLDSETDLAIPAPDTNLLYVDTKPIDVPTSELVERLSADGVRVQPIREYAVWFCTHRDISWADVETTADLIADVLWDRSPTTQWDEFPAIKERSSRDGGGSPYRSCSRPST